MISWTSSQRFRLSYFGRVEAFRRSRIGNSFEGTLARRDYDHRSLKRNGRPKMNEVN
jgi:hypothetical protein